jgi:hypothetical protein
LRSPKTLAALCTDALCRSLPYLDGELPPGLPQDLVDDIVHSLVQHSALNATTLRVLRNCELGSLSLAGARGVTDEWLEPLASRIPSLTSSPQLSPISSHDYSNYSKDMVHMDLDDCGEGDRRPADLFYNTGSHDQHHVEESSCSTSSFHSASSTPYGNPHSTLDHAMLLDPHYQHHLGNMKAPASPMPMEDCMLHYDDPSHDHHFVLSESSMQVGSVTGNMTLLDLRGSQRLTDKGLIQLSNLSRLEVARLDNCHSIVGRGLLAFSTSYRLHTLSLANCRRMTDEAIINISHLTSLEALVLEGCRCLTDRSLAAISGMFQLQKLDLSQCDLLTDSGLEHLEHLNELEELSLGWCRMISDRGIEELTSHAGRDTTLRILRLARCPLTDQGVEYLGRLTSLEDLDLNGCSNIGSAALGKTLSQLLHLASLDVSYCPGIL